LPRFCLLKKITIVLAQSAYERNLLALLVKVVDLHLFCSIGPVHRHALFLAWEFQVFQQRRMAITDQLVLPATFKPREFMLRIKYVRHFIIVCLCPSETVRTLTQSERLACVQPLGLAHPQDLPSTIETLMVSGCIGCAF
jgi:hypothetical protein